MSVNRIFEKKSEGFGPPENPGGFRRNPAVQRPPSERRPAADRRRPNESRGWFERCGGRLSDLDGQDEHGPAVEVEAALQFKHGVIVQPAGEEVHVL